MSTREDISALTDEQLVDRILHANNQAEKDAARNEFLCRYLGQMETRIRAVLYRCGISTSDHDRAVEEIWDRFLDISSLQHILSKFDPTKGNFKPWLMTVVRNAAIDYIREHGKDISQQPIFDDSMIALRPAPLTECPAHTEKLEAIRKAIADLSDDHRIVLRLRFIAYMDLPDADVQLIAEQTKSSVSDVEKRLDQLRDNLVTSERYEEHHHIEGALQALLSSVESLERKIAKAESHLEELGCSSEEIQILRERAETEGIRLADLDEADLAQCRKSVASDKLDSAEIERQARDLQEKTIRLQRERRKREELLEEYHSGDCFVLASYDQIAKVLGLAEGTIKSRLNRAKEKLLAQLTSSRITRMSE